MVILDNYVSYIMRRHLLKDSWIPILLYQEMFQSHCSMVEYVLEYRPSVSFANKGTTGDYSPPPPRHLL